MIRSASIGALLLVFAAGCAKPPLRTATDESPAPIDSAFYAAADGEVFAIDSAASLLLVRVGRAGPAARFGHEHAVASEALQGFMHIGNDGGVRADFAVPIDRLIVDKPEYRERFDFDTQPSPADVEGTTRNMLTVLEPASKPWAVVRVRGRIGSPLDVRVEFGEAVVSYTVEANIQRAAGSLQASATVDATHEELGLQPFSALAGMLRVAESMSVSVEIEGRKLPLD